MRDYELALILNPNLEDEMLETEVGEVKGLIDGLGGRVEGEETWGKRKLAYRIGEFETGYYLILRFQFPPEHVAGLEARLRLRERVVRYLVVLREEVPAVAEQKTEAGGTKGTEDEGREDDEDDKDEEEQGA